jgi:hypothetical protein
MRLLPRKHEEHHERHDGGKGRKFIFHGSFDKKEAAKKREKEIPDSFILERKGRYVVVTARK